MQTWRDHHPDWTYTLYDNSWLKPENFENWRLIETYWDLGLYSGVSDIMRYELLWKYGGFMPEADSICLQPVDALFDRDCAYTVYENEFLKGSLVSPILAAEAGNPFVRHLIDKLAQVEPIDLRQPWKSTGNLFVAEEIEAISPDIVIFPSHYFIPYHFEGLAYTGDGPIYCKQLFGQTRRAYESVPPLQKWRAFKQKQRAKRHLKRANQRHADRIGLFN